MSKKELAYKMNMSPQSLIQRLRTGKFTKKELEAIAKAMNCEYVSYFKFSDGTQV